jgi:N-sulfoglucosamine sulfohydrolase
MNLIYFHTHDSGRYFRHYGYGDAPTEYISRWVVEKGLTFRNGFTPAPTCSPSRAALLTGSYPHSNGMLGLAHRGFGLGDYKHHLVSFLNEQGYHTLLAGVQHEGAGCFDHAAGAKRIGYKEDISAELEDSDLQSGDRTAAWDRENSLRTAQWLSRNNRNKKRPFFLSLGMFATHREYPSLPDPGEPGWRDPELLQPPAGIANTRDNRIDHARFLQSLKDVDDNFRIVMEALEKSPHADDTVVLFTTDHGIALPFHKCNLTGAGCGLTLTLAVPGLTGADAKASPFTDALVSTVDIFPTLCQILTLPVPGHLEGESFAHLFSRPDAEHRDYLFGEVNYHTSYEPMRSVRSRRYSFIKSFQLHYPFMHLSNIDNSPAKELLLADGLPGNLGAREKASLELFDLLADPLEKVNLAADPRFAGTLEKMERILTDWQKRFADPLLVGDLPRPEKAIVNRPECREPDSSDPEDYLP